MAIAEFNEVSSRARAVDHRPAAVLALKPISEKINEIYCGANNFDDEAWDLIGVAGDKAVELIEQFETSPEHAGSMMISLRYIVALLRGAQLILQDMGDERNIEEEGAFSLLSRYVPEIRGNVETLGRQSNVERNGPAAEVEHG
ncbi:MAG: hypothetical protein Q8Q82_13850 [Hydrogenophaga sp.]|nr:hypothetical protein [Hydrogenophaga sp.]